MDEYALKRAREHIATHWAFSDVSERRFPSGVAEVTAAVTVNLPSLCSARGQSRQGVKAREPVRFIFPDLFPLEAPRIFLRSDFPRCFPHINPSGNEVEPCIYAGSLSELLQQTDWMNAILNQLVDWLHKAAADALMNEAQGWEPMRSDQFVGYFVYDESYLESKFVEATRSPQVGEVGASFAGDEKTLYFRRVRLSGDISIKYIFLATNNVIREYAPNAIHTLKDLIMFSESIGINTLRNTIQRVHSGAIREIGIVVTLGLTRPFRLNGSTSNHEYITYAIQKEKNGKRYDIPDSTRAEYLHQLSEQSGSLYRRLSGTHEAATGDFKAAIVGCGSIGSKIVIHLARNGNERFLLVDKDNFLPHNNARHALAYPIIDKKNKLLAREIHCINPGAKCDTANSAYVADYSSSTLIVESTASLAIRSFFMRNTPRPLLISLGLYDAGKAGMLIVESKHSKLADVWAFIFYHAMRDEDLHKILFNEQTESVSIGQSCRSSTLVVCDALISLYSSFFSIRIQRCIEEGMPDRAEIIVARATPSTGLTSRILDVPFFTPVPTRLGDQYSIRIGEKVIEEMQAIADDHAPREFGGVLIGTVFPNAHQIVITGLIEAPPDSIGTTSEFILGVEGLEKAVVELESKSKCKVTYLGTWHSHPRSGSASNTDKSTLERLELIREREPTVCLILTPDGLLRV